MENWSAFNVFHLFLVKFSQTLEILGWSFRASSSIIIRTFYLSCSLWDVNRTRDTSSTVPVSTSSSALQLQMIMNWQLCDFIIQNHTEMYTITWLTLITSTTRSHNKHASCLSRSFIVFLFIEWQLAHFDLHVSNYWALVALEKSPKWVKSSWVAPSGEAVWVSSGPNQE